MYNSRVFVCYSVPWKNEYFNSLKDIDYLALYPEDLQDNFKGIKEKIMPFYYEKFHKERMW